MIQNIKVALIEDDPALQQMYQTKLEIEGFKLTSATNGADGLKVIEIFKPDIILLDLRMPIMNGDEMLVRLREHEWGADIRVIVLTNISKNEAPQSLRFLNVDRYIVKAHSTPAQVVDTIRDVLGLPTSQAR